MLHCRYDVFLMSTTSINLDLTLVTVFSAYIREKYLKCKTQENSNFLKKGKMVISVKIQIFLDLG